MFSIFFEKKRDFFPPWLQHVNVHAVVKDNFHRSTLDRFYAVALDLWSTVRLECQTGHAYSVTGRMTACRGIKTVSHSLTFLLVSVASESADACSS